VGAPLAPPPAYYYPRAPVVYVPPPVVYGGWYGTVTIRAAATAATRGDTVTSGRGPPLALAV
jgi:hypothetical protein